MKRKLIQNLLDSRHADDLRERIAKAIPPESDRSATTAGKILADVVEKSQGAGLLEPAKLYDTVCSTTTAQLADFLRGTPSTDLGQPALAAAQIVLTEALTSKAGRKKTSELPRAQQLAAAQSRRRERAKNEGRKRIDVWLTTEAASYLEVIQESHSCESQAEALEKVLAAAMRGEILTQPKTKTE